MHHYLFQTHVWVRPDCRRYIDHMIEVIMKELVPGKPSHFCLLLQTLEVTSDLL